MLYGMAVTTFLFIEAWQEAGKPKVWEGWGDRFVGRQAMFDFSSREEGCCLGWQLVHSCC